MLPGHDLIAQECLEVSAIAQARYVSKGNFTTAPYLLAELDSRGGQLLIEKLLSLAIKVRFLDDRMGLLRRFGRDLLTIGRYYNDGVLDDDGVTIREALNKLIHHDSIEVHIEEVTAHVVGISSLPAEPAELYKIPLGSYDKQNVLVTVCGRRYGAPWQFDIELFTLINEVLRVLNLSASEASG